MEQIATLVSVQVGTPHHYDYREPDETRTRRWETSFVRTPSPEPRWLHVTHLEGNAQADTKNHGQPHQAVLLYAAAHYPRWQAELDRPDLGPGALAENFTLDGLSEANACVGDIYAVGDARIEVTQPRYPCYKIGRRWDIPDLTARVAATGRTGWYCRVLHEGEITPGLPVLLAARPFPAATIASINDVVHGRNHDPATARELAACPALTPSWQRMLLSRLERDAS